MIIDSNIFLEVTLNQEKADRCKIFLRKILTGENIAYLSNFSIDSIVFSMIRNRIDQKQIEIFLNSLLRYKGLKIYLIKIKDRVNSLKLIEKYDIDYEDALILQSAISTNSEEIISFDKHFDKVKEIKRVEP